MPTRFSLPLLSFLVVQAQCALADVPESVAISRIKIANATHHYVRADAAPGGDGTSWESAFSTIGDALVAATTGAEVWIAGGTYTEALTIQVPLALRGGLDPILSEQEAPVESATPTVIDASGLASSVVTILTASETRLFGLTLTGGSAAQGGGVFSEFTWKIEIHNCRILDNTASERGGGVYVVSPEFTLADSLVQGNVAEGSRTQSGGSSSIFEGIGGGIHLRVATQILMTNSIVRDNRSGAGGSGLEVATSAGAAVTIKDCTIAANAGDFSGAQCGAVQLDNEIFALFERTTLSENRMDRLPVATSLNGAILGDPLTIGELTDCSITANSGMSGILLDDVHLGNCRIEGNAGSGVVGLRIRAASTEVSNNGQRGVSARRGGFFADCVFTGNGRTGLEFLVQGADEVRIERCSIMENGALTLSQPSLSVTGGLFIQGGSATIADSIISGNNGGGFSSGGVDLARVTALLRNCRIEKNASQTGSGGGQFSDSEVIMEQCEVLGNSALQVSFTGSNGIASKGNTSSELSSTLDLTNSIVAGNTGSGRGGVYVEGGDLAVVNSTVQGNRIQGSFAGNLLVLNSIVWHATGGLSTAGFDPVDVRCSNLGEPFLGAGNIFDDPQFILPWDGANADLRLRCGSPAIDSGTIEGAPGFDRMGRARPLGAGVDMGAYENCSRDLNGDSAEDGLDFLYFPSEWYRPVNEDNFVFDLFPTPPSPSRIDSLDLIELLGGNRSLQNGQK